MSLSTSNSKIPAKRNSTEARKVNGRLARELDAVRRLFGPAAMKSLAAKRVVTLDQGEEVTRYTVRPHEAFAWLQSDAARARISRFAAMAQGEQSHEP